jgi:hypothetical protein
LVSCCIEIRYLPGVFHGLLLETSIAHHHSIVIVPGVAWRRRRSLPTNPSNHFVLELPRQPVQVGRHVDSLVLNCHSGALHFGCYSHFDNGIFVGGIVCFKMIQHQKRHYIFQLFYDIPKPIQLMYNQLVSFRGYVSSAYICCTLPLHRQNRQ